MTRRKSGAEPTRVGTGRELVPVQGGAGSRLDAMTVAAGLPAVVTDGGTTLTVGTPYVAGGRLIADASVYRVAGLIGRQRGPWLGEADKVAWCDPVSGYECIILRQADGGHLGGYVGVSPDHPLYGLDADVIPEELGIEVHGGIDYAARCQEGPKSERRVRNEARRICHAGDYATIPTRHATAYRVRHDDAWWFGFRCNHAYDLVPDPAKRRRGFLDREIGQTYRDEGYVHDQVLNLAAQLRAIADGAPMPEPIGERPPPLGLDPGEND